VGIKREKRSRVDEETEKELISREKVKKCYK
jgi:hypothetical protein